MSQMEVVFWSTEILFVNESFILASGNGFGLITNLLILSFFLLVDTTHEIKCRPIFKEEHYSCSLKPFSWIFADIPARENSIFIKFFITMDFWLISKRVLLFRTFFLLLESVT